MNIKQHYHRLRFFVSDAWDEWKHSPGVNTLALATLASSLFLAGLVMLVIGNVESRVESLRQDVRLHVYLENDIEPSTRVALGDELGAAGGVESVEFVDRTEALRRYRAWAGTLADLADELAENPLPASFEVYLAPGPGSEQNGDAIVTLLADRPGVEEVRFDRDWLLRLESLLDLARLGGAVLAVIVFSAVVFVMASVLRLAVHARQAEIDIMHLVGATPGFIRGPFLVAGLGQGLVSSGVALLLIEAVRRGVLSYLGSGEMALVGLVISRSLPLYMAGILVGTGLLVSLAGSFFAVRRAV